MKCRDWNDRLTEPGVFSDGAGKADAALNGMLRSAAQPALE